MMASKPVRNAVAIVVLALSTTMNAATLTIPFEIQEGLSQVDFNIDVLNGGIVGSTPTDATGTIGAEVTTVAGVPTQIDFASGTTFGFNSNPTVFLNVAPNYFEVHVLDLAMTFNNDVSLSVDSSGNFDLTGVSFTLSASDVQISTDLPVILGLVAIIPDPFPFSIVGTLSGGIGNIDLGSGTLSLPISYSAVLFSESPEVSLGIDGTVNAIAVPEVSPVILLCTMGIAGICLFRMRRFVRNG